MKRQTQGGYTLIELMIVVAIVGILAAIAIPQYQDYTVRTRVVEGLNLASAAKSGVSEYYNANGEFPTTNTSAGVAQANTIVGRYVSGVQVGASGIITVTYQNLGIAGTPTLLLTPTTNGGSVSWSCTGGTLVAHYRPGNCR